MSLEALLAKLNERSYSRQKGVRSQLCPFQSHATACSSSRGSQKGDGTTWKRTDVQVEALCRYENSNL